MSILVWTEYTDIFNATGQRQSHPWLDTNEQAHDDVASGRFDASEVRTPMGEGRGWLFRAWRVSERSYAWQTSQMGAPAFGTVDSTPQDALRRARSHGDGR